MRNNSWLAQRMKSIWQDYFSDIPKVNKVEIIFGRKAKRILGSIREEYPNSEKSKTLIRINGHYRDSIVPDFVVDSTITHELCHYAHGFSSPLPQRVNDPHRGDVVERELIRRDLGKGLQMQQDWLAYNWNHITNCRIY